ncbi:hypothetical protein M9H77_23039 [Catharanthus roseus]|uniref:Uncharacterized protein n=1 Tax=Catharanthus roseus TaxID=4058 RepID=A0ACC0ASK4_CATRO|nr:hypothetical protein M9H77_23039 [Catharanthus roseus]
MSKADGGIKCIVFHGMGENSKVCPQESNLLEDGPTNKCGNCAWLGHNKRTCPNVVQPNTTNDSAENKTRMTFKQLHLHQVVKFQHQLQRSQKFVPFVSKQAATIRLATLTEQNSFEGYYLDIGLVFDVDLACKQDGLVIWNNSHLYAYGILINGSGASISKKLEQVLGIVNELLEQLGIRTSTWNDYIIHSININSKSIYINKFKYNNPN